MQIVSHGLLIAVEGIDGSGKSTLAVNLDAALKGAGYATLLTREPGGTEIGKKIRMMLQHQEVPLSTKTEYLLFAADRSQHFNTLVLPALEQKQIVISDRMADSSVAYQGYGRGLDIEMIKTINKWCMSKRDPDIVLYVKIDPEEAITRIKKRAQAFTSFEKEDGLISRVANGFDSLLCNNKRAVVLDGDQSPEKLADQAFKYVIEWIKQNLQ